MSVLTLVTEYGKVERAVTDLTRFLESKLDKTYHNECYELMQQYNKAVDSYYRKT